ncbi:MAG: trans-sulfuration enzyme family protein, partial [Anaerolineales bacterium]
PMPSHPHSHTPTPLHSLFTTAVHSGQLASRPGEPSSPPIVTASGWTQADMQTLDAALGDERAGYVYSRNAAPTQEAFEAAMAEIERGSGAAAFSSGMAALHAALLVAGAKQNATIVAASELYGSTQTLLKALAENSGVRVRHVNIRDLPEAEAALSEASPGGGVLLFEILSNPLCRLADAPALIELARRYRIRTVVDSTFTTPFLIHPLDLGADFVMHSATKYIGGHGDVLAGVVAAATAEDATALRDMRKLLGSNLSPFDAYLALRGLRTLPLRVREQNRNALQLARWLDEHPRVARVYYPGLPHNPDHALARRIFREGCFGAMLAFDLKDAGRAKVFAFMETLKVIQRIASLGDVTSLASYPAHASHRSLTPEQRAGLGIGEGCVRLSPGIEDADDLVADLEQALR